MSLKAIVAEGMLTDGEDWIEHCISYLSKRYAHHLKHDRYNAAYAKAFAVQGAIDDLNKEVERELIGPFDFEESGYGSVKVTLFPYNSIRRKHTFNLRKGG